MNGARLSLKNGMFAVLEEGSTKKFIRDVEQITFSGTVAQRGEKEVIYITERCVFELDKEGGITIVEIAPGLDLEKDILSLMEFRPKISPNFREMPRALFFDSWGGLDKIMGCHQ